MMAIKCHNCNGYTSTTGPILLMRFDSESIKILGLCEHCKYAKSKFFKVGKLPECFETIQVRTTHLKYIPVNGKLVKIYPLLKDIVN